ncbi:histidine kinase [Jatrophihabitans endophyticus]|uniref:sensor histidine kinase n=1 Tax=Jatrophihabitans endophyticus TaxID=1206085 RepID=UPI0019EA9F35|nr:histidine kinase [Jatrophihabitans endophyticus]MBE7189227.1 sensor histidine kinase [Jatrophihabitans endophyticus]
MPPSSPGPAAAARAAVGASLSTLTGVRSGKKSYYLELRRTEERMTSAVQALEGISAALVRTRDDPRALLHGVLRAAAGHVQADWTMLALRRSALPQTETRFLAVGPDGDLVDSERALPAGLGERLRGARTDLDPTTALADGWVTVPMMLDGAVLGRLVASYPLADAADPADLWVLRILANQAAMALQTASLFAAASEQHAHAQHLLDEIERSSTDLQHRTAELQRAEGRLQVLHQRELLDAERHRIALELHDSVAQYVLSAGLAVDLCRAEALEREGGQSQSVARLVHARDLVAQAGDQVRTVIYALHHEPVGDEVVTLSDLLRGLAEQHRPALLVAVRIEGVPDPLGARIEHGLARIAGEALFNTSIHARAGRAAVLLRYLPESVTLWISDDGDGDPRELRRRLRVSQAAAADGRHQGLANMADRATDLGGTFAIRRARQGGIRVEVCIPRPGPTGS